MEMGGPLELLKGSVLLAEPVWDRVRRGRGTSIDLGIVK